VKLRVISAGNQAGGNIKIGPAGEGANKWSYLTGSHYNDTSESEGVSMIGLYASSTENQVVIGGSIYEANPATAINFYTHNAITHGTGGTNRLNINSSGSVTAYFDIRAPIFYDSDNTGYYVDPTSSGLALRTSGYWVADSTSWAGEINGKIQFHGNSWYFGASNYWVFRATSGAEPFVVSQSGVAVASGDMRAPLFYDNNNTAFYTDPASTSVLSALTLGGRSTEQAVYYSGFTLDANTMPGNSTGFTYAVNAPYTGPIVRLGQVDYSLQLNAPYGGGGRFAFRTRNGDTGSFNSWQYPALYDQNVNGGGALYATVYYDQNNTNYYVDPASTSILNDVRSNLLTNINDVSVDAEFGLFFSAGRTSAYGIFREAGAWGHPYPDLRIAFHTGIKIGAAAGYQGVRFYTDYDMATPVMSVNNGSDGLGGGNVYVNNSLQAGSSLRAPIFYDSDNTTYYTNPASTSVMSSVALGGATSVPQGVIWANGNIWLTGGTRKVAFSTDSSTDDGGNVSLFASGNDFIVNNWSGSALNDNFWVFGNSRDAACAGNITAYYSDERLKTKTGNLDNALDKVKSLEGFTYIENELARSVGYNNSKQQVGLSAQKVKAVLPEAVALAPFDYDPQEDGTIVSKSGEDYLTVDYSRLVPLLIEAIKELSAEIEELKAR
jgi:hypothetical protein